MGMCRQQFLTQSRRNDWLVSMKNACSSASTGWRTDRMESCLMERSCTIMRIIFLLYALFFLAEQDCGLCTSGTPTTWTSLGDFGHRGIYLYIPVWGFHTDLYWYIPPYTKQAWYIPVYTASKKWWFFNCSGVAFLSNHAGIHQQIELRLYAIMFFSIDKTRLCTIILDYTRLFYFEKSNDYTLLFHYLTKDDYLNYFTTIISLIFSEHIIAIIAIIAIIHDYLHFFIAS